MAGASIPVKMFSFAYSFPRFLPVNNRPVFSKATKELTYVRRAFKEHGIKVYDERKTRKGVEAKYLCRGYHKEMSMLWTFISSEATILRRLLLGLNTDSYVDPNIPEAMRQIPKLFYQEKTNS
ncbi:hypothetical protein VQ056_28610 [Paenibacillus sp. JTLBN-2024]